MPKIKLIDEKDRKILAELDKNARKTDSEIAKKVGTSKQVVNFRIKNLVKKGIINNFYTVVDISKLGLNCYYLFLQLENVNKEQERKILEKINSLDYIGWLISGMGRWDAVVLINAKDVSDFEKYLNNIVTICGNHLHEYIFTTMVSAEHLNYKFLSNENYSTSQNSDSKKIILDKKDKIILDIISQNARISIVELAEKAKLPLHVANYHLKEMVKNRTIEGFKPKLNINQLGYQWHLLLLQFKQASEKRKSEFIDFCRNHKKIYYVTSTIGNYNLMLDIHVSSVEEFKEVLLDIKDKFSDLIKIYESMIVFEEYKINYIPKT